MLALFAGCSGSGPAVVPHLVINTTGLANGTMGTSYSVTLEASGGKAPYNWRLVSGTLPAGLSLDSATGIISGTPGSAVSGSSLTFAVTDSSTPALSANTTLALTIAPATLQITTASLPGGQVGVGYSATLVATGGTTPYTWSLTSGTLPAGLSFNAGVISGTPTASASASLTFNVVDSGNPAQSSSATLLLSVAPAKLTITTASLPGGQVGASYSVTLTAIGGTAPYTWSITSGTLPAGLSFSGSSGTISGTPTTTASAPLTFQVVDSASPAQSRSVTLTLTVTPGTITVSISPARAALSVTQNLTVSATTNDPAGVSWSISPSGSGGSFNPTSSQSGTNVTFTAPSSAGVYTVTASSVTNTALIASFTLGVTDLAGVYTYHNDLARDGANTHEYALTTANVNTASFGHLFSCPVDGAVYAQPLWVAKLSIGGATHNVVFVATEHDSLFAFDADASPCMQLWSVSLIDTNHGGLGGETTVPSGPTGNLVGQGGGDITPEVGVTGTPVIDPAGILYVVSKSVNSAGTVFYQRLHAIDVTTGNEKAGSPAVIAATFPGTADCGSGNTNFSPQQNNQRPGLALVNGAVYIGWSSHEDTAPYCGWMVGYSYNGSTFSQSSVLNVTPNSGYGGIWMGGGAPSADNNGHIYVITGNGTFDATSASAPNNDYGDAFLQLNSSLGITSFFTPSDQLNDDVNDVDFGAGGAALVVNTASGPLQHLVIGGGKDEVVYLLNGDNMGGSGDSNALQYFNVGNSIYSTGAFWNNSFYLVPAPSSAMAYAFNPGTNLFNTNSTSQSAHAFGFPGSTPSISASGASSNGILWALDNTNYCTPTIPPTGCGPAVLHAFDATNLANELWNSSLVSADAAGNAVKFTVPTVANGKVYVGDRGNNTGGNFGSTSVSGQLDVYGLKPN